MTFNLTHAQHDPAHCLVPGLFRSLKRGDRKKLKLDVTCQFGKDSLRFWGPEPLGADDMRVLQGLVALAPVSSGACRGILLHPEPRTEAGHQLRLLLETKFDAAELDGLVVKGSYRQLAKEIGYADIDGGAAFKTIRACIERLWSVSVIAERDGRRQGFRILSDYESDSNDGRLFVALNPRLANAILGQAQYFRISLDEVRQLKTDPARLIHQRLHWINAGQSGRVTIETLCSYVWPDLSSGSTLRTRKATVKKVLIELADLGWLSSEYATGKYEITRPLADTPRNNTNAPPE